MGRQPQAKLRGIQVFTYKEVEAATEKLNEGNVIGNGGYGVVYRGVLSDGTVAAIKVLQREGKQWERAFRLEVTSFIAIFIYLLSQSFTTVAFNSSLVAGGYTEPLTLPIFGPTSWLLR